MRIGQQFRVLRIAAAALAITGVASGSAGAATGPAKVFAAAASPKVPQTTQQCLTSGVRCYQPQQLRTAYGIDKLNKLGIDGRGTKIGIIMSPTTTLASDLNRASKTFGLPKPKLKIIQPLGPVPPSPGGGIVEPTLDTQMVHLMAPRAEIVFVAVPGASLSAAVLEAAPLATAVDAAVNAGVDVISMSFGGIEQQYAPFRAALARARQRGVALVTGSGDTGVAMEGYPGMRQSYPATDSNVTAAGGTLLTLNSKGVRELPDVAWGPDVAGGASGGGVSTLNALPSWQRGVRRVIPAGRNYPDVSMSGALSGSVIIAITAPENGEQLYVPVAGTSEASPLFAGVIALATQAAGKRLPNVNRALYKLAGKQGSGINDVVLGNNTFQQVPGYVAVEGYDRVTGVGTVWGPQFVPQLAKHGR